MVSLRPRVPSLPGGHPGCHPSVPGSQSPPHRGPETTYPSPGSPPPAPDPAWASVLGALGFSGRGPRVMRLRKGEAASGYRARRPGRPLLTAAPGPAGPRWAKGPGAAAGGSPNGGPSSTGQPRTVAVGTHKSLLWVPQGTVPRKHSGLGLSLCPRLIGMWFPLSCPPHVTRGSTGEGYACPRGREHTGCAQMPGSRMLDVRMPACGDTGMLGCGGVLMLGCGAAHQHSLSRAAP